MAGGGLPSEFTRRVQSAREDEVVLRRDLDNLPRVPEARAPDVPTTSQYHPDRATRATSCEVSGASAYLCVGALSGVYWGQRYNSVDRGGVIDGEDE